MEAVTGHYLTMSLDEQESKDLEVLLMWIYNNASDPNLRVKAQRFLDVLVW